MARTILLTHGKTLCPACFSLLLTLVSVPTGVASGAGEEKGKAAGRPPNVVLILVDDLGWTDLGFMGSDLYQTPNIDRLAARGLRFDNAYSACTVCSPTRAAVLTGKYPARLHVTDWIHGSKRPRARLKIPEWTEFLPDDETTLAEALRPAGYASACVGKWHLGDDPGQFPTRQGFDVNVAGFGAGSTPSHFSPYKIPTLKDGPPGEYLADRLSAEACRFIEANRERPFFLYLPYYAVHTPLQAKPELIEKYRQKIKPGLRHINATYAAMIESLDEGVGRVLNALDSQGVADRTIVLFTSDNGGLIQPTYATVNVPLRAGKGSTYEGGVRVPLVIHWPGVTSAGGVCHEPVLSIDFFPTLLEIAGVPRREKDKDAAGDGLSLVPLLRDPGARLDREAIYWHYPHYHPGGATPYGAVRARDWKLIEFYEDDRVELYNLADDLGETRDLARTLPEKADALRRQLHAWRRSVGAQMPTPNPDYDPAQPDAIPKKAAPKKKASTRP
jgi:arylsulfatase A-like enzyme